MTGKELLIALAGAGIVGGGAGVAGSLAAAPKADSAPQTAPEVLSRLTAAEDELAKTKAAIEASRKSVGELQERVTAAEINAAKKGESPLVAAGTKAGSRVMRVRRSAAAGSEKGDSEVALGELKDAMGGIEIDTNSLGDLGDQVGVQIGKALEGMGGDFSGAALERGAFKAGLDLRKLPEDQRWQKAQSDLGLTWNQVEDLKKAVADRDAAMKDATTTETKTGANGGVIKIQRPDAGKTAHVEADYHDKLGKTLNEDQKKNWHDKGYDHAFGSGPFGGGHGAVMMSIDVSSDKDGAAPKDGAK